MSGRPCPRAGRLRGVPARGYGEGREAGYGGGRGLGARARPQLGPRAPFRFRCDCADTGYEGERCELEVLECASVCLIINS